MVRRVVVVLPGTPETSRNIAEYLRDLDIEIKIIPVIKTEVDWGEIERARKLLSSNINIDLSVFTSKTAVNIVKNHIPEAWKHAEKYSLAIGPGTASLLKSLGVNIVETSEKHSSIGIMEMVDRKTSDIRISLYCSKNVSNVLEEFLRIKFVESYIFKLYTIREKRENIKKIVNLIESSSSTKFLIIITSLQVLKTLYKEKRLQSTHNVIYSAISKRIYEEASRLNLKISHISQSEKISDYYDSLRSYIKTLHKRF